MGIAILAGMRDIQHVIETLLAKWPAGFWNKHLELFLKVPQHAGMFVQPINLEPMVARTVLNVVRFGD